MLVTRVLVLSENKQIMHTSVALLEKLIGAEMC